jgi:hypothetical protein
LQLTPTLSQTVCCQEAQKSEAYIGIVIGSLSVTVLLLLATIFLILRKNRQKIFSKHSCKLALLFTL